VGPPQVPLVPDPMVQLQEELDRALIKSVRWGRCTFLYAAPSCISCVESGYRQ
jgi:hypothetical protein